MSCALKPVAFDRASAVMDLPLQPPMACSRPASMAILMAAFRSGW